MEMEEQEKEEMAEQDVGEKSAETIYSKAKLSHIIRWLLLLPVSFFGAILFHIVSEYIIFGLLKVTDTMPPFLGYTLRIGLYGFIFGFSFAVIASVIAPDYKKLTAYIFCTIFLSLSAISNELYASLYAILLAFVSAGCILPAVIIPKRKSVIK